MRTQCVAGILKNSSEKILLLHRNSTREKAPNCWGVVSGHIEKGEEPNTAIKREVLEELSINVGDPIVSGGLVHVTEQLVQPFLFSVDKKTEKLIKLDPSEHDQLRWIDPMELPGFTTVPGLWNDLQSVQVRPNRLIIGVVGKNASGKDTVVDRLVYGHGFIKIHLSEFVKAEALRRNISLTRKNLNQVSQDLLTQEGPEVLSQRAISLIEKHNWTRVAIAGIRTTDNVASFARFYNQGEILHQHSPFRLWAVQVSSDKERFARMLVRASLRDPQTWGEFQEQEAREEQLFGITNTEQLADKTLMNDGTLKKLYQQIDTSVTIAL